jgi:hypothetical protein
MPNRKTEMAFFQNNNGNNYLSIFAENDSSAKEYNVYEIPADKVKNYLKILFTVTILMLSTTIFNTAYVFVNLVRGVPISLNTEIYFFATTLILLLIIVIRNLTLKVVKKNLKDCDINIPSSRMMYTSMFFFGLNGLFMLVAPQWNNTHINLWVMPIYIIVMVFSYKRFLAIGKKQSGLNK